MSLDGFVRVFNNSGEEYENAQSRLVVGTINLVEKIAQLAQIPISDVSRLSEQAQGDMRRKAALAFMNAPAPQGAAAGMGGGMLGGKPKEIIKEGLSEYFIYTVEGTETIKTGWSKRMRSFEGQTVPFKIQYRYRPQEYGDQLVRMYLLTNNEESKLGTTPVPDGLVRVFRDNGRDGLSYLTEQTVKDLPIGDKTGLNLRPEPEVIFELIKVQSWRDNLWLHVTGARELRRVADGVIIKEDM